jgi:DNA sulfur modification protein DndD
MIEKNIELKITGWTYSGFKTPDVSVEIPDNNNTRNFTLLQMLSGEGKTTTLNLIRNSFFDMNKNFNSNEIKKFIEAIRSDNPEIIEGVFEIKFKLNNNINYRIKVTYDYIEVRVSYETIQGDSTGYNSGLILPNNITRYITPEFINTTFFDLELTERLYEGDKQQTDKIINTLCKLDYLDEVSNSLEIFLKEFRKKNQGKLKDNELIQRELAYEKIKIHFKQVEIKSQKQIETRSNINKKIKEIETSLEKIQNEKSEIKEKIFKAKENLDNKNETLRESLILAFNYIKNPMTLNDDLKNELLFFEENLTKKRIPKGVGEAFFDEIIESNECLCGHAMTSKMRENILKNKELHLDKENFSILNPIKTSIKNFEDNKEAQTLFNTLIKNEREANIAKNEFDKVYQDTADEIFNNLSIEKERCLKELEEVDNWIKNIYEKPYDPRDPPNTECKKTLERRISDLDNEINERSKTLTEAKKINKLKEWLNNVKKISLNKISVKIIEDINKEVKRVLPLEKIYVDNIKDKITLKKADGKKRSGASRGQMARIAYLFLINLLNRSNLKFPLIVDSPVTALDSIGRSEIAKGLVKDHNGQYIGFIFDVEKEQFSEILEKELSNNINLITVFHKSEDSKHMLELAKSHEIDTEKFENGVVSYNSIFFNKFTGVK